MQNLFNNFHKLQIGYEQLWLGGYNESQSIWYGTQTQFLRIEEDTISKQIWTCSHPIFRIIY